MKRYLFDTNAISHILDEHPPEKWRRPWDDVRMGRGRLLLFEPNISEMYYKGIQKLGRRSSRDRMVWLKTLPRADVIRLRDKDAFAAGEIKVGRSGSSLSLVDCFALELAKSHGAMLLTMDHSVRDEAKRMGVRCSFIPFPCRG